MFSKVRTTAAVVLAMLVVTTANAQPSQSPEQACAVGDVLESGDSCDVLFDIPYGITQPNDSLAIVDHTLYRFTTQPNGEWRWDCLSSGCVGSYQTLGFSSSAPSERVWLRPPPVWLEPNGQSLGWSRLRGVPNFARRVVD